MPEDFSSHCECPNCLEDTQSESDWDSSSNRKGDCPLYSRSSKKSMPSHSMQQMHSQVCPNRPENDKKEDSMFLPPEEESSVGFSKKPHFCWSPEDFKKKIKPLREITIQDLLKEFGHSVKFQPNCMSLGHFRDHVVMKFRRALYYSGIWVKHVQGCKMEKHLSANYFKTNPNTLHRLVPWLKRELTAVYGDYGYTVKNILTAILHHMTKYDLDSESFIHLLEPYLLQHTHHFLHEFISFVHSPYNMETYDQRAIYQCLSAPTMMEIKPTASTPVLPLPEHQLLMTSHLPKNTRVQWDKTEEKPQSATKTFPNGNSSSKSSKISLTHHKTTSKIHVCIKDQPESGDHKGIVSPSNKFLNWEIGPDTLNYNKNVQDKKTEGTKLFPGHVPDLQMNETIAPTFPIPTKQTQPWKFSLREKRASSPGQKYFKRTEVEKNKLEESSPNVFQRLPRGRSLVRCKSRDRSPCNCILETILCPTRNGRKAESFRKRGKTFRQPSQHVEVGSHPSRRTERKSSSRTQRSKSWCVEPRTSSISRKVSNLSLRGSHHSECFPQNECCESSQDNVHGYEPDYMRASLNPVQYAKLSSPAGKKLNCPSKDVSDSLTGRHGNRLTCLQSEKHRSPSKQETKQQIMFCSGPSALRYRKNKCQCPDSQSTASGDLEELEDKGQSSNHYDYIPSFRKQTRTKREFTSSGTLWSQE